MCQITDRLDIIKGLPRLQGHRRGRHTVMTLPNVLPTQPVIPLLHEKHVELGFGYACKGKRCGNAADVSDHHCNFESVTRRRHLIDI